MTPAPGFESGRDWTPTALSDPDYDRMVEWEENGVLVRGWAMGALWVIPDRDNPTICKPPEWWRYAR